MKTAILLLAAGSATRMGTAKQLLPWRGTTLVRHAADTALRVPDAEVFVVVGAHKGKVIGELKALSVNVVHNSGYEEGLGSSIAAGVREILAPARRRPSRLLIMLADQPSVTATFLAGLLRRSEREASIVAAAYSGRAGVPAVFPAHYFDVLQNLGGDAGAGQLLNGGEAPVTLIQPDVDLFDIDTPEDYQRYEGNQERH
ncbi:molybdenum cofactor cytidylyltransferase [Neolewinella xylanilytica]|uniref:Molybdenum cofactor cytidylyltransferase n=1 Tax=Neolewinella xylanilytica TaxID=1514080 RepID=A0A2S6I514_9BACT|nr:nucleotidyltransferase family protein [Neolewinella xylanilytica]PPK86240.1 molybdenum cofactor cytidylyltransferase [Neolewinella xylanilytica]